MKNERSVKLETIERGLKDPDWKVRAAAMNISFMCRVPSGTVKDWIFSDDAGFRAAAMNALVPYGELPERILLQGLYDEDWIVRSFAMKACKGKNVSESILEKGLTDPSYDVREAALDACRGRQLTRETDLRWAGSDLRYLRAAAAASKKEEHDRSAADCALSDDDWFVRTELMRSYQSLEGGLEHLKAGLDDVNINVKNAAMRSCWGKKTGAETLQSWLESDT